MPIRYPSRPGPSARAESTGTSGDGLGEWWAAIAVLAFATLAIVSLSGSAGSERPKAPPDRTPEILASLTPAEHSLAAIESAFESLCHEPVLLALELVPDCETGVITLPDELFSGPGSARLGPVAQQDVGAAVTTYLARLRKLPAIWESLDGIEIRGHTDPRALRKPYSTNMVGSQQRALGVYLFLIGPSGLREKDRDDLERLAIVSGAAFSRPPASCPEESRECYDEWRRVEIRPVLSESLRRGDWSRTLQDVRVAAGRTKAQPSDETTQR